MSARWLALLLGLLPACSCGDSMPRSTSPPDATASAPDEGLDEPDAAPVDEPITCIVRCEPLETLADAGIEGPFGELPVTALVSHEGGLATLFRGTSPGTLPGERIGPSQFHLYPVLLDERSGEIRTAVGVIGDDSWYDVIEGATMRAIPAGLEAVFVHAPDPRREETDGRPLPYLDSAVHLTVARWSDEGELLSVTPLGEMGPVVPSCDCRGHVALDARGTSGAVAIAVRGALHAAALDLGAVPALGASVEVLSLAASLEQTSSLSVALLASNEVAFVGGGFGLERDAIAPFGARGRLDPLAVSRIPVSGDVADPPPIVRAWRDGFVVARHVQPSGDVAAGAVHLAIYDGAAVLLRELIVPTASGIPPVALDVVVGPTDEAAMVWLARSPDGAPEVAVNVTPLDVPAACDVLNVDAAGTLPARIALPLMSAAARGDAVDLLTVGDTQTWSRVPPCSVELP